MSNHNPEARLLTEEQAAAYLSLSRAFLRKSRMKRMRAKSNDGPPWVRCGGAVRYAITDLDEWIERNRCECAVATPRDHVPKLGERGRPNE